MQPPTIAIAHSLALDEERGHLYLADRENSRILEFDAQSGALLLHLQLSDPVFAIAVNKKGIFLYLITKV